MKLTITAEYLKENGYKFTVDDKGHITLNGDFYCYNNQLTELYIPDNFTCGGVFDCSGNKLTELHIPDNFTCGGGFHCSNNQLTELHIPDNFTCGGDFYCSNNQLTELHIPDNFTCGGSFYCSNNQLTELYIPDNFTCGGGFHCYNNKLTELHIPDNFTCGGSFHCYNNKLTELHIPDNFTCGRGFDCSGNKLTELHIPDNFTCGGVFDCSENKLTELHIPDNFTCRGDFYCCNNQLKKKPKIKTFTHVDLSNKLTWRNGKFRKIDGIFCEVVKQVKDVLKVKVFGQKGFAFVFCKKNVYAHGNTIKQAYRDWLFKTSDRDVSDYNNIDKNKKYDLNYWIVAYRTITGACSFGTNEYLENNKDKYKNKMTLNEVFEATKGQYGHNTFVEFFNNND